MRLGIRAKIFLSTIAVIAISLTFSGVFASIYFASILRDQIIKDNQVQLHQVSQQIEYIQRGIIQCAQYIVTHREIQEFVKRLDKEENTHQILNFDSEIKHLLAYSNLKDYIDSAAIITPKGRVYITSSPDRKDFKLRLNGEWYQRIKRKSLTDVFSDPYSVTINDSTQKVISYVAHFRDLEDPDHVIGELIINIDSDTFNNIIIEGCRGFDGYVCVNNDNTFLFSRGKEQYLLKLFNILNDEQKNPSQKVYYLDESDALAILDQSMSSGWKIVSFNSKEKIFEKIKYIFYIFVLFTIMSLILFTIIILPIIYSITRPISRLVGAMNEVSKGNLGVNLTISSRDEMEALSHSFNKMVKDLQKYINESIENEQIKKKMELDLLISKINPHFIYNTLNSVIYLARIHKNYDIVSMVESFIHVLQDTVKVGEDGAFATLSEEIDIVNNYVVIQKFRYAGRFELIYQIEDEELLGNPVPRTLIQPLVENALFHGICPKEEKGSILIRISSHGDDLIISVEDDGVGMDENKLKGLLKSTNVQKPGSGLRSIGLTNIHERIRNIYGEGYGLHIESKLNEGTKVTANIPLKDINDNLT